MADRASQRVVVGRIAGPYGVKGWLKVLSYTEPDTNLFAYGPLEMRLGESWEPVEIDQHRRHGKGLVMHVAGCDDRNDAQCLVGRELACRQAALPELGAADYYWSQLEGLEVVTRAESLVLGRVDHLLETGANDVLVVAPTADSCDGRERLIPWLPGNTVCEVDLAGSRVVVDWDPSF